MMSFIVFKSLERAIRSFEVCILVELGSPLVVKVVLNSKTSREPSLVAVALSGYSGKMPINSLNLGLWRYMPAFTVWKREL